MGSESQKKIGMSRGVDTTRTNPLNLFIVGLDGEGDTERARIDWLKGIFPALADKIEAERDPRSVIEIPEWFMTDFTPSDADPVKYENMGVFFPDGCGVWSGKALLLINDGRQRTKTFRKWNETNGGDMGILCLQKKFNSPIAASMAKARGNVRIPQSPMQRAWLAQEFETAGMSVDKIAPLVGVTSGQAVRNLLVLVDASPAVQAAVEAGIDAGGITQTSAQDLVSSCGKDFAKQDARLPGVVGLKGGKARSAAKGEGSEGAPKPIKPAQLDAVASQLTAAGLIDYTAIVRWARGDVDAFDALPDAFREAVNAAAKAVEKKGKKTSVAVPANEVEQEAA